MDGDAGGGPGDAEDLARPFLCSHKPWEPPNILQRSKKMEPIHYLVTKIEGDYAILRTIDRPEAVEASVALALLPDGVAEGDRLLWEDLEYIIQ